MAAKNMCKPGLKMTFDFFFLLNTNRNCFSCFSVHTKHPLILQELHRRCLQLCDRVVQQTQHSEPHLHTIIHDSYKNNAIKIIGNKSNTWNGIT